MAVRNIGGLSESSRKWIIASYLYEAKLKIDSLSYIAKHHKKLPSGALRNMIKPLYLSFFIECSATIDNYVDKVSDSKSQEHKTRQKIQADYPEIKEIYHWRDKFAAHHDLDALGYGLCGSFSSWHSHIERMKWLLDCVLIVCKDCLPSEFSIDYVEHDAVAFRLENRINADCEKRIFELQHPFRQQSIDNSNTKELIVINDVDDVCRYLRGRYVMSDPNGVCIVLETGINKEETLQNLQRRCIVLNTLYDMNMWISKGKNYNDKELDDFNNRMIQFIKESNC